MKQDCTCKVVIIQNLFCCDRVSRAAIERGAYRIELVSIVFIDLVICLDLVRHKIDDNDIAHDRSADVMTEWQDNVLTQGHTHVLSSLDILEYRKFANSTVKKVQKLHSNYFSRAMYMTIIFKAYSPISWASDKRALNKSNFVNIAAKLCSL